MNTPENKANKPGKKYKVFKSKGDMIGTIIVAVIFVAIILSIVFSPDMYLITTAKWTDWNETDKINVVTAMGEENTEERFRLYFQYYNVIHELGHGLIEYNKGVDVAVADEEQLVNDFAVAYWNYYGEPEKMAELYDFVTYAVENVGDNYENGVDYLELAKKHSDHDSFNNEFFNYNEWGLYFPKAHQTFSDDPNMNVSRPVKNVLGIVSLF